MAGESPAQVNVAKKPAGYTVKRYRASRYWQVLDAAGQLVCVTVYKRGAVEVARRLTT
jgi:hypothetical protein